MIIIDSFTGYSSLNCHSWLLRDCRSCIQALLTFRVSIEKTDVNLIAPPLCVSWVFSLQILLSFTYSIYQCFDYYVTQSISFLFWSICILYAFFFLNRHLFLYTGEIFFYDFAEYVFSVFDLGIFLLYT